MFIGGVGPKVKSSDVKSHFEKYGEVTWVELIGEKYKNPRGYGFLKFKEEQALLKVLKESQVIKGRAVDCRIAKSDATEPQESGINSSSEKLFVHNIPKRTTKEELSSHFSQAGEVTEILLILRKFKSKSFAYISFKDPASLKKAVELTQLKDAILRVKIADPKSVVKQRKKNVKKTKQKEKRKSMQSSSKRVETKSVKKPFSKKGLDDSRFESESEKGPNHSKDNLRFNHSRPRPSRALTRPYPCLMDPLLHNSTHLIYQNVMTCWNWRPYALTGAL